MTDRPDTDALVLRSAQLDRFDRGNGVATFPIMGKWNLAHNTVTSGITAFAPGTGLPLHTHNVEETVLVIEGLATATIGDEEFELEVGDTTWVPAGVPHRFRHRGGDLMRIYWVYGGRDVTRTNCLTGETVEHLSERDRGGIRTD
ncbi:hypothetical protein GCM10023322_80100 [Rugosimonospora acidiphila]|uniref:Cupin type-2 domain-containing protein n=1 Tax=Rugosimonospora acidiphila TaxID=556531 RepID=A0ABP9STS6_9ACTN